MNKLKANRFTALVSTRILQNEIDVFFDKVGDASTIFVRLVKIYLQENGPSEGFHQALEEINGIESQADELRRNIESYLYEKTLIPDLRSDVLSLIEAVDNLLSPQMAVCYALKIETPVIPVQFHPGFTNLLECTDMCMADLLRAARAFFRDTGAVRDYCHKVNFAESQADKLSTSLRTAVFSSDLDKVEMLHLRYFIERIDMLANRAEDIADALAIYALKRMM